MLERDIAESLACVALQLLFGSNDFVRTLPTVKLSILPIYETSTGENCYWMFAKLN